MIAVSQHVDIKHELEDEIALMNDAIEELTWPISSAYALVGMIDCVVEDLWDKDDKQAAYTYNGSDLPMEECSYSNGEKYSCQQHVWSDDVYCTIEANY